MLGIHGRKNRTQVIAEKCFNHVWYKFCGCIANVTSYFFLLEICDFKTSSSLKFTCSLNPQEVKVTTSVWCWEHGVCVATQMLSSLMRLQVLVWPQCYLRLCESSSYCFSRAHAFSLISLSPPPKCPFLLWKPYFQFRQKTSCLISKILLHLETGRYKKNPSPLKS